MRQVYDKIFVLTSGMIDNEMIQFVKDNQTANTRKR